jgi:prefoldin subunit 5
MQTNLFEEEPINVDNSKFTLIKQIELINEQIIKLENKKSTLKQAKRILEFDKLIEELKEEGQKVWSEINSL